MAVITLDPTKCAPLSPSGLYRVAVNDYIAGGGSGFIVLKRNTSQQNTGISLRDALTVYLNKQAQVCNTGVPCDAATPCMAPQMCTETPRGSFCTVTTDALIDATDMQSPQRSVKQRWGNISCLDGEVEKHDGRIRPVFE